MRFFLSRLWPFSSWSDVTTTAGGTTDFHNTATDGTNPKEAIRLANATRPDAATKLGQQARPFAAAAPILRDGESLPFILDGSPERTRQVSAALLETLRQSGNDRGARSALQKLQSLKSHDTIARLIHHTAVDDVMRSRHGFATIDDVATALKKRQGELGIGFFEKIKLGVTLAPLLGDLSLLKTLSQRFGELTGLSEGAAALEILSVLFETPHAAAASRAVLREVWEGLKE